MLTLALVDSVSVPADNAWLGAEERAVLDAMRVLKRRTDWRMGRLAAKRAVAAVAGVDGAAVTVRAAEDGAPEAFVNGLPVDATVSISHSAGWAVCLVASPRQEVGCDLECVEPRAGVFVRDWFLPSERGIVDHAETAERDLVVTLVWSAKESAFKALRCGLRRDTRSVEVSLGGREVDGWHSLHVVDLESGAAMPGWWRQTMDLVLTVVTSSETCPPALLGGADDKRLVPP